MTQFNSYNAIATISPGDYLLINDISDTSATAAGGTVHTVLISSLSAYFHAAIGSLGYKATINNTDWSGDVLTVSNGGTGASTTGSIRSLLNLASLAFQDSVNDNDWSGSALAIINGGTGHSSSGSIKTMLGLSGLAYQDSVNNGDWSGAALAVANGGTGGSTSGSLKTLLGLSGLAYVDSVDNSNWSGTALAVANGGTGGSTSGSLKSLLGLQALAYSDSVDNGVWSGTALAVVNGGTGGSTSGSLKTLLGLDTLAYQNSVNNADWSGTPLTVANGGTGGSTTASAQQNLGVEVGVDVLAFSSYTAATTAAIDTGTDTDSYVSPDALVSSYAGTKELIFEIFDCATDCATATGTAAGDVVVPLPDSVDGMILTGVEFFVYTAGTTGDMDIELYNIDRTATSATLLSTPARIDTGDIGTKSASRTLVIDAGRYTAVAGQRIRAEITTVQTTPAKGLYGILKYNLP